MSTQVLEPEAITTTLEELERIFDQESPVCSWPGCDHLAHVNLIFTCDCSNVLCSCCLMLFYKMAAKPITSGGTYDCPHCHTKIPLIVGRLFMDCVVKDIQPI